MSQNKIKILVPCHKPCDVYRDDVYTPIHVGRSISQFKLEMSDMIGDDAGDNISEKNNKYSELTAQYWGWKNLDCEYIGLCHYRRYFVSRITVENIDNILSGHDVILRKKSVMGGCLMNWLAESTCLEDAYIFYFVLQKMFPDKKQIIEHYFWKTNILYANNMFICKKDLFDKFAEWQFRILSETEKYLRPSGYIRMNRAIGYMAESLWGLFVLISGLRVREMDIVGMLGDKGPSARTKFLEAIFTFRSSMIFAFTIKKPKWITAAIAGLKADGIYQQLHNETL